MKLLSIFLFTICAARAQIQIPSGSGGGGSGTVATSTATNPSGTACSTAGALVLYTTPTPKQLWVCDGTTYRYLLSTDPSTGTGGLALTEGDEPAGANLPPAGAQSLWLSSTDHLPYLINSSGLSQRILVDISCTDAGANDTYACSATVAPVAYVTGTARYRFKANTANTGAATFNLNALGAKTIKKAAGGITTDLADNDIRAGQWVDLIYDGTNMQMVSLLGNAPAGGASVIADCSDISVSCVLEPFMNGSNSTAAIGALGWALMSTGGTITTAAGVAGHWGIYQMSAAAAANNVSGIDLSGTTGGNPLPPLTAESNWTVYYKFRTPATITETAILVGLYAGGVSQVFPVDGIVGSGVFARYYSGTGCNNTAIANGTDATWIYVTKSGTSTSTLNTGPAIAASTWYWLRITSDGAGGVKFSMKADGGTFPADTTVTTTIPTGTVTPVFKIAACEAVVKVLQADEFRIIRTGLN